MADVIVNPITPGENPTPQMDQGTVRLEVTAEMARIHANSVNALKAGDIITTTTAFMRSTAVFEQLYKNDTAYASIKKYTESAYDEGLDNKGSSLNQRLISQSGVRTGCRITSKDDQVQLKLYNNLAREAPRDLNTIGSAMAMSATVYRDKLNDTTTLELRGVMHQLQDVYHALQQGARASTYPTVPYDDRTSAIVKMLSSLMRDHPHVEFCNHVASAEGLAVTWFGTGLATHDEEEDCRRILREDALGWDMFDFDVLGQQVQHAARMMIEVSLDALALTTLAKCLQSIQEQRCPQCLRASGRQINIGTPLL
ncbi:hypothetical protein HDU87_008594 [Geranomyces variabilis]|uniref:Uncharacterized protein n=1 Tax=Geranomyces variabilis TaxID=109894 RepID=A0AAD5TR50_9FUNG|nr:hypothetical protein HDU87_008594 [Geranomyces variabilis]